MTSQPLAYKDRWMREYGGTIDEVCETGTPLVLNNDDRTAVVIALTSDEFNRLFSAVAIGAMLQWPDQQYEVIWSLLKGVECGMDFCQRVAQCIYFSDDVKLALQLWALSQGLLSGSDTGVPDIIDSVVADSGTGCDDSDRYGLAYEVVDVINTICEDVFDYLDQLTTLAETAAGLMKSVPIIGTAAGTAIDIAQFFLDYAHATYTAAYTSAVHQEFACDIFCQMGDNCQITLANIQAALRLVLQGYEPPPPFSSLADVATWLITITFDTDSAVVAAVMFVLLEVWSRGSPWLGTTQKELAIAGYTYLPIDPTGICSTCPSCDLWLGGNDSYEDWTIEPVNVNHYAIYNATEDRFEATYSGAGIYGKHIRISLDLGTPTPIDHIRIVTEHAGTRSPYADLIIYLDDTSYQNKKVLSAGERESVWYFDGETTYQVITFQIYVRTNADDAAAFGYFKLIEVCTA